MGVTQINVFFLLSTLLIGLYVRIAAGRRIRQERVAVRLAVTRNLLEEGYYWLSGILPALILTVITIGLGLTLPTGPAIMLAVVSFLAALLMPGYSPLYLGVVGALALAIPTGWWRVMGLAGGTVTGWGPTMMLLVGVALIFNAYIAIRGHRPVSSPRVLTRKHQTWARYHVWQLLWLPLVLPVPGSWLAVLPWWHALGLGMGHGEFYFMLIPLFLGFGFNHQSASARPALHRTAWVEGVVGMLAVIVAGGEQWHLVPAAMGTMGMAAVSLIAIIILWLLRRSRVQVTLVHPGVRVVGVVADTPAERMGLVPGDVVVQCNSTDVTDTATLYNASQHLGTFCRLRVHDTAGEFRIVETAIYTGTPHLLGIITFPED